jgi:alpha-N-arabinofuranosidase
MILTPGGQSYLMPLGKVTALYRRHMGRQFVRVSGGPSDLDITASRTGDEFFLHVVNTNRSSPHSRLLTIDGLVVDSGRAFEIAADPTAEITSAKDDPMRLTEQACIPGQPYRFSAASVTAIRMQVRASCA